MAAAPCAGVPRVRARLASYETVDALLRLQEHVLEMGSKGAGLRTPSLHWVPVTVPKSAHVPLAGVAHTRGEPP